MVLINIFLAAVIYLVISLKLEKSAGEFHEKRLRKEMDDILREFNAAAERNITLLEHKIQTARRLLELAGELPHVDVRVGEEEFEKRHNEEFPEKLPREKEMPDERVTGVTEGKKKGLPVLFHEFKSRIQALVTERKVFSWKPSAPLPEKEEGSGHGSGNSVKSDDNPAASRSGGIDFRIDEPAGPSITKEADSLSTYEKFSREEKKQINRSGPERAATEEKMGDESVFTKKDGEGDLEERFRETSDVYSLTCELYRRGYPVEELARHSGLSVGEISLVVNLHSEQ